jgi:hypothetical protein
MTGLHVDICIYINVRGSLCKNIFFINFNLAPFLIGMFDKLFECFSNFYLK